MVKRETETKAKSRGADWTYNTTDSIWFYGDRQ